MKDAAFVKDSVVGCYVVEKSEDITANLALLVKDWPDKQVEDPKGKKGMEDSKCSVPIYAATLC